MRAVPICIPLHSSGGKLKDNTELRFALRSIATHFKEPYQIVIVGERLPSWITDVEHIRAKGLKSALVAAANAFPTGFFWYYDDCCLLRDTAAGPMRVTGACRSWMTAKTPWAAQLDKIKKRLESEGFKAWDYSRPHGPYWFTKAMVDEGFADWPGMKAKFPWESWILSKHDWPRRHGSVKQYYGPFGGEPKAHAFYLNYNDDGNTIELRDYLATRFPDPSPFELTEPRQAPKPMKIIPEKLNPDVVVHTLRFGNPWWLPVCAKTLDAWCARHHYTLRVWTLDDVSPDYPCAKFSVIDMLRDFVAGDAKWMIFCDADIYIHHTMEAFPALTDSSGFFVKPDQHQGVYRSFAQWCSNRFKIRKARLKDWVYRNTGVWVCDRDTAKKLLEFIQPPFFQRVQEQHQLNWWLWHLARSGVTVGTLPDAWNCMPGQENPEDHRAFYHLCGSQKKHRFDTWRSGGYIQEAPVQLVEGAFDPTPYDITAHPWAMDIRHIQMLHAATTIDCGTPNNKRVAVEVGSFQGASTCALVEAVNQGRFSELHIVEPRPTAELRAVLSRCYFPERIHLHTQPMWEITFDRIDFIFIDGDHKAGAFADALIALSYGASVICLHDSNAPMNAHFWGASSVGRAFRRMPGRDYFEDCEHRMDCATHRGFLVSVRPGLDLTPVAALASDLQAGCVDDFEEEPSLPESVQD